MGVREEWVWMSEGLFLWKANYTSEWSEWGPVTNGD